MPSFSKMLRKTIGDGARSNKFNVIFNFKDNKGFEKKLSLTCKSCDYPNISTRTFDFKYKGQVIPIPLSSYYDHDWNAEFFLGENHQVKDFFDDWMIVYNARGENSSMSGINFKDKIKLADGSVFSSFNDNFFTVDVDIYQFDFETNILPDTIEGATAHYRLYNVFPISVMKLSTSENDDILTAKVNFRYSYFERF